MANREQGEIDIELGEPRTLRLTFNAVQAMEDATGVPMEEMDRRIKPMRRIRISVWAMLLHKDPDLKLADVGELIDQAPGDSLQEKIKYVGDKVGECYAASLSEAAKKKLAKELRERIGGEGVDGLGEAYKRLLSPSSASVPESSGV